MSLNDVQLPGQLLQDLYKKNLYDTGEQTPAVKTAAKAASVPATPAAEQQPEPLRFLGKNQQKIVICVSYEGLAFIPDQQLEFLANILKACKLTLADVAIINLQQTGPLTYQQLQQETQYRYLLLFGNEASILSLPVNFPGYQVQAFNNCTYLSADPLELIEADKELKTRLWTSLKKIFGI
jgi:hypothetical protein